MYIEMELLARERYESRLREAEASYLRRNQTGALTVNARVARHLPRPRLRRR